MSAHLFIALILSASPTYDAQRGVVRGLRVADASVEVGATVSFTVTGTNPCGAVELTYGDGKFIAHPIREVPVTITYQYSSPGTYDVRARGVGNCDGEAAASVRVREASRPAARPDEDDERIDDEDDLDWTSRRHRILDRDRDGRITTAEWPYSRQMFRRIDRNRDGGLSEREFLGETDDDRSDRFGNEAPDADGARTIVVESTERWTDTGIDIRRGDLLTFDAAGSVQLSADGADVADPGGARSGRSAPDAPVRRGLAGALIARVGTDAPIVVGGRGGPLRAPVSGRLYLGVNDDFLGDNRGAFRVRIAVEERRRR